MRSLILSLSTLLVRIFFKDKFTNASKSNSVNYKKILVINTLVSQGGAAVYANSLINLFTKRHNSIFKYLVSDILPAESDVTTNLNYIQRPSYKRLLSLEGKLLLPSLLKVPKNLKSEVANFQPDIIHLHNAHGNYFSPLLIPELSNNFPFVWTLHDTLMLYQDFEPGKEIIGEVDPHNNLTREQLTYNRRILKNIYQKSKLNLVTPSKWLQNKLPQSILSGHNSWVIPFGLDLNTFLPAKNKSQLRAEMGIPTDAFVIIFAAYGGAANSWKGGTYLQECYAELKNHQDIFFINLGGEKDTKVDKQWHNTGYISDKNLISKYFALSDVMLYPSIFDSLSIVCIEAQACGLPVVAFNTGGVPEAVLNNKTGFIVKYKSVIELVEKTLELKNNPDLLAKMSDAARTRASDLFDEDKMVQEYDKVYEYAIKTFVT